MRQSLQICMMTFVLYALTVKARTSYVEIDCDHSDAGFTGDFDILAGHQRNPFIPCFRKSKDGRSIRPRTERGFTASQASATAHDGLSGESNVLSRTEVIRRSRAGGL